VLSCLLLATLAAFGVGPAAPVKHTDASPKAAGAAGLLAIAQHQLEAGNSEAAARYALSAAAQAPTLNDYAHYIRAQAEVNLKAYDEVAKSAARVFNQLPVSPLVGATAALAVQAELDADRPRDGLDLIRKYYDRIPQPQADLLLARCLQATGDLAQAAEYFQRVYYYYPTAIKEATDAANALVVIQQQMGSSYPLPSPEKMIDRAQKLFDAKHAAAAKIELAAAIPHLTGADRDLARVRLGVADFLANNVRDAFTYLSALKVDTPEPEAERLNYVIRCARKLDNHADVKPFLALLAEQHPNSPWRLDALILVADQGRVDNDPATYLPLYRDCATSFAADKRSAWCHWQIAFASYRKDGADAETLLRDHIQRYADSEDANNAVYFLGRLAERKNNLPAAKACYLELENRFANTYYAVVAQERMKDPGLRAVDPDPALVEFLHSAPWRARPEFPSFLPGKLAQIRLDRATLLHLAALNDFAEDELKFGARNDGEQENVYAFQLAKYAAERGVEDQAVRYIKNYAPSYLYISLDQAPVQFWKLAFPIPYRASIEQHSRTQSLDPFLIAALIRQESEFNPKAISYAKAYGLMQLLPGTGRDLARHLRIRRFTTAQLLTSERNLQLGTFYFHNLLTSYGGQTELALASYNAGPGRANIWRTWGPFREQAEFVEMVPFHQTRSYIQIILRNADIYRRLYAGTVPDVPVYHAKPAPKTTVRGRTAPRRHTSKRKQVKPVTRNLPRRDA
jgi:peptidoglycan lytic transglycosylase